MKARRAQSEDDYETWETGRPAPTLNAFDNGTESRATVLVDGVRRLTPRECERLMGWPDDHTRWAADGSEIADTNRYKMAGNGVAAPVAEWVASKILKAWACEGSTLLEDRTSDRQGTRVQLPTGPQLPGAA